MKNNKEYRTVIEFRRPWFGFKSGVVVPVKLIDELDTASKDRVMRIVGLLSHKCQSRVHIDEVNTALVERVVGQVKYGEMNDDQIVSKCVGWLKEQFNHDKKKLRNYKRRSWVAFAALILSMGFAGWKPSGFAIGLVFISYCLHSGLSDIYAEKKRGLDLIEREVDLTTGWMFDGSEAPDRKSSNK